MTFNLHAISEATQSYLAVFLTYDLMHIGAVILLIARLTVDVPPALGYIRNKLCRKK